MSEVRKDLSPNDIRHLEGKLFTFIESLGLNELQDNGAKGTLRDILWSWYDADRPDFDK